MSTYSLRQIPLWIARFAVFFTSVMLSFTFNWKVAVVFLGSGLLLVMVAKRLFHSAQSSYKEARTLLPSSGKQASHSADRRLVITALIFAYLLGFATFGGAFLFTYTYTAKYTPAPIIPQYELIRPSTTDPWFFRDVNDRALELEYIRYLGRRTAVNDTIVLIPTNANFTTVALNLECSLRRQGVSNVLFWALDQDAYVSLTARGHTTYFNPSLYGTSEGVIYHTGDYNRMMRERPKVWSMFLESGISYLWMDADVAALGNPFEALHYDADVEIQSDGVEDLKQWKEAASDPNGILPVPAWGPCAGVFHIRASPTTVRLMSLIAEKIASDDEIEDQQAFQSILSDRSRTHVLNGPKDLNLEADPTSAHENGRFIARYIDPQAWLNGHFFYRTDRKVLMENGKWTYVAVENEETNETFTMDLEQPLLVHANGNWDKEDTMRKHGAWFLDEQGRCRI